MVEQPRDSIPSTLRPTLAELPPRVKWSYWRLTDNPHLYVVALEVQLKDRTVASQFVWDDREKEIEAHPCILNVRLATAMRILDGRLAQYESP